MRCQHRRREVDRWCRPGSCGAGSTLLVPSTMRQTVGVDGAGVTISHLEAEPDASSWPPAPVVALPMLTVALPSPWITTLDPGAGGHIETARGWCSIVAGAVPEVAGSVTTNVPPSSLSAWIQQWAEWRQLQLLGGR